MFKAIGDFFRKIMNAPPEDASRVPLAEATVFYSAFNDGPFPDELMKSTTPEGVAREEVLVAIFGEKGSKNWWSFITRTPFDIDWFDFVTSAVKDHGVTLELDFLDDAICSARCAGRAIAITREHGLPSHAEHDRFLNAIRTILPGELEFRPMWTNHDPGDNDVFGYGVLTRDVWARLDREAPGMIAKCFVPLSTTEPAEFSSVR